MDSMILKMAHGEAYDPETPYHAAEALELQDIYNSLGKDIRRSRHYDFVKVECFRFGSMRWSLGW